MKYTIATIYISVTEKESKFKADLEEKDDKILALTVKLDNAFSELSNLKDTLEENSKEFEAKENQLEELRAKGVGRGKSSFGVACK